MQTEVEIGIDPDTTATGIAVLMNGALLSTHVVRARGRLAFDRAEEMGCNLQRTLSEVWDKLHNRRYHPMADQTITIIVEWQKPRPGDPRPQSITDLAIVAGMAYQAALHAFPTAKILRPYPAEWKGTIPKPVHQKRIKREMFHSSDDQSLETTWGKTHASHVLDAIGLALAFRKGKIR